MQDVIVKMKVPVAVYYKNKQKTKVAYRDYEVQDVNYSQMKRDQERANTRMVERHRRHQQRVSH